MTNPRVIVCQHGARHRYAIAKILEKADMLEALYTDSCEYSMLGKIANAMRPLAKGSLRRLADRKIQCIPNNKIRSTDLPFWSVFIHCTLKRIPAKERFHKEHTALSRKMIKWGVENADIIYSMHHASLDFLKFAQSKGKRIVVDVYNTPLTTSMIESEKRSLSSSECNAPMGKVLQKDEILAQCCVIADLILCPSNWVVSGVRKVYPEYAHKIRICPYGSSINYNGRINAPDKGRYFWAGREWIRKGLHYLAEAADELKQRYPEMQFRAAGITDPRVTRMERFRNITFLGKLNTEQMQDEYLRADAFVFPTLSEGMAGVVIEALAAGCPVITTKAAGIDAIDNEKNGLLVPTKNGKALVEAIEKLYLNRTFRDTISKATMILAQDYSENAWGQRLVSVITSLR